MFNGAPNDKFLELAIKLFDEMKERELLYMSYINALKKEVTLNPSLKTLLPHVNFSPYDI